MIHVEIAWNDRFPPINLYNYPIKDVWKTAQLIENNVLTEEVIQATMHGSE